MAEHLITRRQASELVRWYRLGDAVGPPVTISDKQTGIALRFIRAFDPRADMLFPRAFGPGSRLYPLPRPADEDDGA